MAAEDYLLGLQPPTTCGKRPRSPVDKLADLAATAEDDEQDWRSSKRYLTEVIASGFSKLSFKLGTPPSPQQQQQQGFDATQMLPQHQQQRQASLSPKQTVWLPGQLVHGAAPLQLPTDCSSADCSPMDTQMSPPRWLPPNGQQQQHKPAFPPQATSPGASTSAGGGLFGAWAAQQQAPMPSGQPGAVLTGSSSSRQPSIVRSTPSPEPFISYDAAAAAGTAAASEAAAGAAAAGGGGGGGSPGSGHEAGGGSGSGNSGSKPTGLPPLQTAKVLRAAEKQPNSPSDLPTASLRKVALLRSLLARAEQQYQQQQTGFGQQQQQPLPQPQQQQQAQPSRMQPAAAGGFAGLPAAYQQQQAAGGGEDGSSTALWMQPWGATIPGGSGSSCMGGAGGQHAAQGSSQQQHVLPPRPVTPWDMSSDDMDCSSASSVMDSDGSSSQQGPPDLGPPGLQQAVGAAGGRQNPQSASLLCEEVLGLDDAQQQQQPLRIGCRARHNMQLPFFSQASNCAAAEGSSAAACSPAHHQQQEQQGLPPLSMQPAAANGMLAAAAPPPPAAAAGRGSSPELSRQKLEELRAKALASTSQLTCLTQEDLHSLQLGLASRRGSCDSSHTPSGLQQESTRATAAAAAAASSSAANGLRRHTVS